MPRLFASPARLHPLLSIGLAAQCALCAALGGEPPPSLRVLLDEETAASVSLGSSALAWEPARKKAQIMLRNSSAEPVTLHVQTCLLCAAQNRSGGLLGLTRGFVGVMLLGASEIPSPGGVESTHTLQPGEELSVEHPLPPSAQAHEVITHVTLSGKRGTACLEAREAQVKKMRQNRDSYHQARKEEEERWKEARGRLIALQAQCSPLSQEYKACLEEYWKALGTHKDRIKSLETEHPAPSSPPAQPPAQGRTQTQP